MRVVHCSSLYEPRGIPAHATAWRLVEQPFPRGSLCLPLPSAGRGAPLPPGGQSNSEHKMSKLRLWI
jgi:hypothetical protein